MTSMCGVVQLAFMKSLAVWDDIEIYTDAIGLLVTLHLAQIEVEDFYSCNDMFYQTSVTKHIVRWEKELTTLSLKDKGIEINLNVSPKFNTNIDTNRGKTESYPKPSINLPDNDINGTRV